jgi:hypothetical protein
MNAHTCMMDGEWSDGKEKDERLPMTVLAPSLHWNFTEQHLLEMKSAMVSLKDACWSNLQGCVSEKQYLPELSPGTTKPMTQLRRKAEELIDPFVKHLIAKLYPNVRYFRVGAIRSKGKTSQAELSGSYHRDYQQGNVTMRHANEWPLSTILALDEFNFEYKNQMWDKGRKSVFPLCMQQFFQVRSVIVDAQTEQMITSINCLRMLYLMMLVIRLEQLRETVTIITVRK